MPKPDSQRRRRAHRNGVPSATRRCDLAAEPRDRSLQRTERADRWTRWIWVLPALLAILAFANTCWNEFAYDDAILIRYLSRSEELPWRELIPVRRALTFVTHLIGYELWGARSEMHHLVNVLLHALASALVTRLTFTLTGRRLAALACGSLFAIHPVHVEAVASVSNRTDILAMILVSLAMLAWIRSRTSPRAQLLAILLYLLAMWAKDAAAAGLAGAFIAYELLFPPEATGSARRWLRPVIVAVAPLILVLVFLEVPYTDGAPGTRGPMEKLRVETVGAITGYGDVLATVLASVLQQLRLLVWPIQLSVDYPLEAQSSFLSLPSLAGATVLVVSLAVAWRTAKSLPAAAFGILWTILMFLPSSNVVPLVHFFVQDRFLYVPSFGACLIAGVVFDRLFDDPAGSRLRRSFLVGFLALAVAAGAVRSIRRNQDWKDECSLWYSSLDAGVKTWRVLRGVTQCAFEAREYERAIEYADRLLHAGIELDSYRFAHGVLGESYFCLGRYDLSVVHYRLLVESDPAQSHRLGLAKALIHSGEDEEGQRICTDILREDPENPAAKTLIAVLSARREGGER